MYFRSAVTASGLLLLSTLIVVRAADIDEEIRASIVKSIQKTESTLSEARITEVLDGLQNLCPNKPINGSSVATTVNLCLRTKFGNTSFNADGNLDEVFKKACQRYSQTRECMTPFNRVFESCWSEGYKWQKKYVHMTEYFCGDSNDGEKAAKFVADGGFKCFKEHGTTLGECIALTIQDVEEVPGGTFGLATKVDTCDSLKKQHDCYGTQMKKCDSNVPGNLITGMYREVSVRLGCSNISAASGTLSATLTWLIVPIVLFMYIREGTVITVLAVK